VLADFPGITGLFLACLYSGTLSTISSGLNSIAAVVWTDFIKPTTYGSKITDNRATHLNKFIGIIHYFINHLVLECKMNQRWAGGGMGGYPP
jgi:Na+/proline symporter